MVSQSDLPSPRGPAALSAAVDVGRRGYRGPDPGGRGARPIGSAGMGLMKIAIVGAGAIGGYAGVKLALAGERVTFLARGANLEAIRSRGLKLILSRSEEHTSELQSPCNLVCRLLLDKKQRKRDTYHYGSPTNLRLPPQCTPAASAPSPSRRRRCAPARQPASYAPGEPDSCSRAVVHG